MNEFKSNDPLHGVTLERLLTDLVAHCGWEEMGRRIEIRCFLFDPSIKSSLVFLRKNPWARTKVEEMYVAWKTRNPEKLSAQTQQREGLSKASPIRCITKR